MVKKTNDGDEHEAEVKVDPKDRDGQLKEFLKKVNKEYGKGTIQSAEDSLFVDVPRIPTGVFALDFALGGGVPAGRVTLFYGQKSSSKSTTALRVISEAQKMCATCFKMLDGTENKCKCKEHRRFITGWIDIEGCFENSWARNLGVKLNDVVLSRPEYAEQAIDIMEGLLRGGACVSGSENVVIPSEGRVVSIRDFVSHSKREVGTVQLNPCGKKAIGIYKGKKNCLKITTERGRSITVTPDHRMLTFGTWIRADKLKIGDDVAYVSQPFYGKKSIGRDRARFIGYILGDGNVVVKGRVSFSNKRLDLLRDYQRIIEDVFGDKVVRRHQSSYFRETTVETTVISIKKLHHNPGYNFHKPEISNTAQFINRIGLAGKKFDTKFIPECVLNGSRHEIAECIAGYWMTDGCCPVGKRSAIAGGKNEIMVRQIQGLLLRLGIDSRLYYKKGEKWYIDIRSTDDLKIFLKTIPIFGKKRKHLEDVLKYHSSERNNTSKCLPLRFGELVLSEIEKSGTGIADLCRRIKYKDRGGIKRSSLRRERLTRERATRIARALKSKKLLSIIKSPLMWDRVKKVERVGKVEVFDISVPTTGNFIASDFVVHNCDLIVLDSIAALSPSEELEKSSEKDQMGLLARRVNKGVRKWISALNYCGREYGRTPTIILINQIRMKIGVFFGNPESIPGGLYQQYGASVIVKTWSKKAEIDDDTGKPISSLMCFNVERSKVSTPHIAGEYIMVESPTDLKKAGDVADEEYLVDLALKYGIAKKESSKEFIINGISFMAKSQVVKYLMENLEDCSKLKKQLMEILTKI